MFYCHIEKPNEANQRVTNAFFDLRTGEFLLIAFLLTVIFSLFFCVLWALIKSKRQFNFIHMVGTHEELLKNSPIYQEVYEQQTGGREDA